jgi:hypothetical protein
MSVLELSFPDVVDDRAARTVASGVIVVAVAALLTQSPLLVALLAVGFWLRVLYGPRYSPLALLTTRVLVPRYPGHPRLVPGPPKRFAQGIGATWTTAAALLLAVGATGAGWTLVALLLVPAGLEATLGFCVGCHAFRLLMKAGVIPNDVCDRCVW